MLRKLLLSVLIISSSFVLTFAAPEPKTGPDAYLCLSCAGGFINNLNSVVVAALGTLFLALAVVGFFLGVVRFIWAQQQGEEKGIKAGKETLKWGIVALFCAFSVYGIIRFGQSVLFQNPDDATKIKVPKFIIDTTPTGNGTGAGAGSSGKPEIGGRGSGAGSGSSGRPETGGGTGAGSGSSGRPEGGTGGSSFNPANQAYINCILSGTSVSLCQTARDNILNSGDTTQANAQAAFDGCRSNNVDLATCQTAYTRAGGQGNALQGLADSSRQQCLDAGNSASTCSDVYTAVLTSGYADIPTPDPIKEPVITDPPANDASCFNKNNSDSCDAGSGADSGYCAAGSCMPNDANP